MQDAKKSPKIRHGHHRTTLSGYIFATKEHIDNRKNLLNSNISHTCSHNMVNFRPLTAEICWRVWGTPSKFQRVSRLDSVTARYSSSGRQSNFAALNRGRHLYSAGRPSRWALAHILVLSIFLGHAISDTCNVWHSIVIFSESVFQTQHPSIPLP